MAHKQSTLSEYPGEGYPVFAISPTSPSTSALHPTSANMNTKRNPPASTRELDTNSTYSLLDEESTSVERGMRVPHILPAGVGDDIDEEGDDEADDGLLVLLAKSGGLWLS